MSSPSPSQESDHTTGTTTPVGGKRRSLVMRLRDRLMPGFRARRQARKQKRRREIFSSQLWEHGDSLAQRHYQSYQDYLSHQAEKLDRIHDRRVRKEALAVDDFRRRFEGCEPLAGARTVLCLGARLGAEVRALRDLGHFAVGIDLNPGTDNDYVCHGDFHELKYADGSVDAVYTNALDHVFDLDRVVKEVHRILRPGGLFILDMLPGYEEGFIPGEYEATHWRRSDDLLAAIAAAAPLTAGQPRDLGGYGGNAWRQVVFTNAE